MFVALCTELKQDRCSCEMFPPQVCSAAQNMKQEHGVSFSNNDSSGISWPKHHQTMQQIRVILAFARCGGVLLQLLHSYKVPTVLLGSSNEKTYRHI